jgi:signal transduction histidine kinase
MRFVFIIVFILIVMSCSEDSNNHIELPKTEDLLSVNKTIDSLNERSSYNVRIVPDSGIEIGKRAYELAKKYNYTEGMAMALKLIGSNYWSKGYFDIGLDYFFKSLEYYEKLQDLDGISRVLNNIGLIFLTTNENEKSIDYFERSIEINKKIDSRIMLGNSYFNLGLVYNSEKKFEKSIKQIDMSLPYLLESNNISGYSQALSYQGDNYLELKKYDKAKEYFDKAWNSIDTTTDIRSKTIVMNHYSNYYLTTGNPRKALGYARDAYQLTLELDLKYDQWVATEYLSKSFAGLNLFDSAYKYKSINATLIDSLRDEESIRKKKELEMEYEFSKKTRQMEIEQHKKELELENKIYRGQLFIYFISVAFVLLLIVAYIIYRDYKQKTKLNDLLTQKNSQITQQKEELERLNNDLDAANSTKDKFFSIIAHDLRNPIFSFRQVIDLLQENFDTFDESERKDFIGLMKKSSERVYMLLENLLTWSRSQRGIIEFKPEKFDLSALVNLTVDLLSAQATKKGIELINLIPEEIIIYADSNMINTMLRNLMSNAIKFTEKGGKVEIGATLNNDSVEIYVKDNGVGMDKATSAKLFRIDEAFTTEGTNEEVGTGLGLILCKEFIEQHNGEISVESTPNQGSKFKIIIPQER